MRKDNSENIHRHMYIPKNGFKSPLPLGTVLIRLLTRFLSPPTSTLYNAKKVGHRSEVGIILDEFGDIQKDIYCAFRKDKVH